MCLGLHVEYRLLNVMARVSKKYSNIKFRENSSNGSRVVSYGRTDRKKNQHDEANSRFPQFFERA